jgi:Thermolysin metallopeptidase, catalytic domain
VRHRAFCSIIPPYLLRILAEDKDPQIRERAKATLDATARARTIRATLSGAIRPAALAAAGAGAIPSRKIRRIFSCEGTSDLSRKLIMQEGDQPPANDVAVQEAHNYAGVTWDFYNKVFGRNSIDNAGLTMVSSVHYSENGQGFDNALDNPVPASVAERIPDAFVYSFEMDEAGAKKEVEVSSTRVPDALRKLLP